METARDGDVVMCMGAGSIGTVPAKVVENDNFAGAVDTLARTLGGFGFVAGARDAAILISLPAGGYTVTVSGADGGTGLAIVELYKLP